jgi:hypothetical protein
LIALALLLGLAPALWRLTSAEVPAPSAARKADDVKEQDIPVELAFTQAPTRARIAYLGKTVWEKASPEAAEELTLHLVWPKEGGELQFSVDWPEGASLSAMRVKLTDPEHGEIERTLWGRGAKTGVLRFP